MQKILGIKQDLAEVVVEAKEALSDHIVRLWDLVPISVEVSVFLPSGTALFPLNLALDTLKMKTVSMVKLVEELALLSKVKSHQ